MIVDTAVAEQPFPAACDELHRIPAGRTATRTSRGSCCSPCFAGMAISGPAAALDTADRVIERRWRAARAWLQREISPIFEIHDGVCPPTAHV